MGDVSSVTTNVKLPAQTRVSVKLSAYKDPHVLSLTDTYTDTAYVSKLMASRKIFLHRLDTSHVNLLQPCVHTPVVPKLWRAAVPPSIEECSVLERDMLASLVIAVKRWCMDQAQRRRDMHEKWIQSALEYCIQVKELHVSENLLVTFIVKEMNGGQLVKPLPPYEHAAAEYAKWLIQPPEKSVEVVQRSKKYAKAAAMHSERQSNVQSRKAELESSGVIGEMQGMPDIAAVKLSISAKQCVKWVQDTAHKWVADLFDHEDSLHMKRLNV